MGRFKPLSSNLSHTMYLLISFGKSTPHKIVNIMFTITNYSVKLTVLGGR